MPDDRGELLDYVVPACCVFVLLGAAVSVRHVLEKRRLAEQTEMGSLLHTLQVVLGYHGNDKSCEKCLPLSELLEVVGGVKIVKKTPPQGEPYDVLFPANSLEVKEGVAKVMRIDPKALKAFEPYFSSIIQREDGRLELGSPMPWR